MKKRLLLLGVWILSSSIVWGQVYRFKPTPSWVKMVSIPSDTSFAKDNVSSGFYSKLQDRQVNLEKGITFFHDVRGITSHTGITNASQLSISFDTLYQRLEIHYLYVWRKGKKIDRTKNLTIELINQEKSLEQGLYTGQITAYDILEDIRKDDLIDLAYSIVGENPIFEDKKFVLSYFESSNPVDLIYTRVIYPKEKTYIYTCEDCDSSSFSTRIEGAYRVIEISKKHILPTLYEEGMPTWTLPKSYFLLSSTRSWLEVNTWAQRVFAQKKEPVLDAVFQELFDGKETMDDKINKLIDYVQDDVRYMGIEVGIGSFKPFSPEVVVKRRFGDCKDKSLLLVSLLKKIGVNQAYPVLVNTLLQNNITQLYPTGHIFNHCIVRFDYEGKTFWVDPTNQRQGGNFRTMATYPYGKALVVGLNADTLQDMNLTPQVHQKTLEEEYTSEDLKGITKLKLVIHSYGLAADMERVAYEYFSLKGISERILNTLKLTYPKISSSQEPNVQDDINNNHFSITYQFDIEDFWANPNDKQTEKSNGKWKRLQYEPIVLFYYMYHFPCKERKYDLMTRPILQIKHHAHFQLPEDIFMNGDQMMIEDNAFFSFRRDIAQTDQNVLDIHHQYETKSELIKAQDFGGICKKMTSTAEALPVMIYYSLL